MREKETEKGNESQKATRKRGIEERKRWRERINNGVCVPYCERHIDSPHWDVSLLNPPDSQKAGAASGNTTLKVIAHWCYTVPKSLHALSAIFQSCDFQPFTCLSCTCSNSAADAVRVSTEALGKIAILCKAWKCVRMKHDDAEWTTSAKLNSVDEQQLYWPLTVGAAAASSESMSQHFLVRGCDTHAHAHTCRDWQLHADAISSVRCLAATRQWLLRFMRAKSEMVDYYRWRAVT